MNQPIADTTHLSDMNDFNGYGTLLVEKSTTGVFYLYNSFAIIAGHFF